MTLRDLALAAAIESARRKGPLHDVLNEMLSASTLDRRDRALAEEIAFGALRRRLQLELALSCVTSRPVARMQPALAEALRQAAYQMLFLDRVPAHAAVNETVGLVKLRMGRRPAEFANAVLRALGAAVVKKGAARPEGGDARRALAGRDGTFVLLAEAMLPDPAGDQAGHLAGLYGYPLWMVERWLARCGAERTERILEWGNTPPGLSVRLNPLRTGSWPLEAGEAERVFRLCRRFEPGEVAGTYRIEPEVQPAELPGLAEGLYAIQDEAQARPARVLAPERGARVLDLCAGLGGKSCQLAELVGPGGRVIALDTNARKLARAREAAARLGLGNISFVRGDALAPPSEAGAEFRYVMLDAPCSNLGSLDRRPEVRFRASPEATRRLAEKEAALLRAALERAGRGGVVVYSVCSFEAEETSDVVRAVLGGREDFRLEGEYLALPEPGRRGGGYSARLRRSPSGEGSAKS